MPNPYIMMKKNLINLIFEELKEEKSISAVSRGLEKSGYKIHRLSLTGYLKALADLGLIKEKALPPSKIYTIPVRSEKDIYELIGEKVKELNRKEDEKKKILLFILQTIFKRAVYQEEIKRCGFEIPRNLKGIVNKEMNEVNVSIAIPKNDVAYKTKEKYFDEFADVVSELLVQQFAIKRKISMQAKLRID
ncbi:MAG: hypothetical protein AB1779_05635 [Candidatus Thermoplasmatota archaeon]